MHRRAASLFSFKNYNLFIKYYCSSNNTKPRLRPHLTRDAFYEAIISEENNHKNWDSFSESVLHKLNKMEHDIKLENLDNLILSHCLWMERFHIVDKYLEHLNLTNSKPKLATEGKILRLLYLKNRYNCSKKDEEIIINRYENLRKIYPLLDSITLDNSVAALSITNKWRECLNLIEEIKISASLNRTAYSNIISAAFRNDEHDMGFKLLEEMFNSDKVADDYIFENYFASINKITDKNRFISKLDRIFNYIKDKEIILTTKSIDIIAQSLKNKKCPTLHVEVPPKGYCKSCRQKLHKFDLSNDEFDELKNTLFKKVIVGKDVFLKSHPDELEKFKNFVEKMENFDVVLDGLNVAYSTGSNKGARHYAELVLAVVSYFHKQGKSVLLLGRVHMNKWPKSIWETIKRQSTIFLTQNISQDDPYLLYCAISAGKNTIIVSKDLMRGHKFLLGEPRLKVLFNRWLVQNQYHLVRVDKQTRVPVFRIPPEFSAVAQKNGNYWHIPHESNNESDNRNYQKTWLCVKTKT